jgi:hypothetical protein
MAWATLLFIVHRDKDLLHLHIIQDIRIIQLNTKDIKARIFKENFTHLHINSTSRNMPPNNTPVSKTLDLVVFNVVNPITVRLTDAKRFANHDSFSELPKA